MPPKSRKRSTFCSKRPPTQKSWLRACTARELGLNTVTPPSKHKATQGIQPMLFQCWSALPLLVQHWNSIGWMPRVCWEDCIIFLQICRNTMPSSHLPRKHNVVHHHGQANTYTRHSTNAVSMLGQRRRRWPIIEKLTAPTIFIVFAWYIASAVILEVSVTKFCCIRGGAVQLNSDQYNYK